MRITKKIMRIRHSTHVVMSHYDHNSKSSYIEQIEKNEIVFIGGVEILVLFLLFFVKKKNYKKKNLFSESLMGDSSCIEFNDTNEYIQGQTTLTHSSEQANICKKKKKSILK